MTLWAGRRLGRYETLKRQAEEQNRIKDDIHRRITSRRPGDRVLSKQEYRTMGLAASASKRGGLAWLLRRG